MTRETLVRAAARIAVVTIESAVVVIVLALIDKAFGWERHGDFPITESFLRVFTAVCNFWRMLLTATDATAALLGASYVLLTAFAWLLYFADWLPVGVRPSRWAIYLAYKVLDVTEAEKAKNDDGESSEVQL